ncbi:hypothetical protein AB6813_16850 [bacterium RCC_150]
MWDTPNVAHDNPADQRFSASIILGFADQAAATPSSAVLLSTTSPIS